MAALGERNWYLPGWLGWMPRVGLADHAGPGPAVGATQVQREGTAVS